MLQQPRCIVAAMPRRKSDEKLTPPQVAERLGITTSAWRAYVARAKKARDAGRETPSLAPQPDGHYSPRAPWWWASTIERWNEARRGPGWRAGQGKQ